jgi:hypothetical protein
MKMHLKLLSAAATAILLAALPGHLYGDEIDACYKITSGKLRLITDSSSVCLPSEDSISWNQQGPPGTCDVTPPSISYTLNCQDPFELTLEVDIVDDEEVAFYATQRQGGDPPLNILVFVEPGQSSEHYELTVGVGPDEVSYLLVATDIEGNVAKELFSIPADFCGAVP